jgi:hypothetical protein
MKRNILSKRSQKDRNAGGTMDKKIIACKMMKDELEHIFEVHGIDLPIFWKDDTLHANPEKLKAELQRQIDAIEEPSELLMAYGNCGNGLLGLKSGVHRLIIPRYADCISMLLHQREDLNTLRTNTYFVTRGWLNGEMGLEKEYDYSLKRYGEKRTQRIMDALYRHYQYLMMIETEAYDPEKEKKRVANIGKRLNMKPVYVSGDLSILEKLLLGDWTEEDFIIIEPGEMTVLDDFSGNVLDARQGM